MRLQVIGVLVFAAVLATCAAVDAVAAGVVAADTVPFTSTRPGEVVVSVLIGGRGPFRFLLDTGSTHTAVTESLGLRRLNLTPVARTSMRTSSGSVLCPVVQLPEVAVGSARAGDLMVTVLPAAAGAALGPGIDGVIGQDFLARFNYAVDYQHSRVVWNAAADGRPGVRLRLVASAGRFLVALPQDDTGDAPVVHLVPDSGADAIVFFGDAAARRLLLKDRGEARLTSLAGNGGVSTVVVDQLRVGSTTVRDQVAAIAPARTEGEDGDGLLPLHLFANVFFNNRDGYLLVEMR